MRYFDGIWQKKSPVSVLLYPLSAIFCLLVLIRRRLYRWGWLARERLPVPVIVIGNISVGGTGKTPLVIWMVRHLQAGGWRPGVVTRGYGGRSDVWPLPVTLITSPADAGDEPVLIAKRCGCPVIAGPDRIADGKALIEAGCDIIVSDDGLQHYRLARDLEISVVDGVRRFGNGWCLPAGPLREPVSRLADVHCRVTTGRAGPGEICMELGDPELVTLDGSRSESGLGRFAGQSVHALAGIGHPERFFSFLRQAGLDVVPHAFPDHHEFRESDLEFGDGRPVLMTEKDGVKCRRFARTGFWVVAITAKPEAELAITINRNLAEIRRGQTTS